MKAIKKIAATSVVINGSIVDTFNVEDKVHNAPSIRAIEEKLVTKANASDVSTSIEEIETTESTHYLELFNAYNIVHSEIETIQNDYYKSSDFAVITNTGSDIQTINYPSGFTRDNCVITSVMVDNRIQIGGTQTAQVVLGASNIQITHINSSTIKVVLMKIY